MKTFGGFTMLMTVKRIITVLWKGSIEMNVVNWLNWFMSNLCKSVLAVEEVVPWARLLAALCFAQVTGQCWATTPPWPRRPVDPADSPSQSASEHGLRPYRTPSQVRLYLRTRAETLRYSSATKTRQLHDHLQTFKKSHYTHKIKREKIYTYNNCFI